MKNYAELLNKLTKYGPRVIITSMSMRYYAQINSVNFYADKDYICYELKREKGVYLVMGKVGVSSDKEVYENWHEAMNMLSAEKELVEKLPLDLEKLNNNVCDGGGHGATSTAFNKRKW